MKIKIFEGRSISIVESSVNDFIKKNNVNVKNVNVCSRNLDVALVLMYDEYKTNNTNNVLANNK